MWRVPLPVDEEQMIAARPAGDVDVFPELDRPFGAEDEQPPVAPGRQAVLREPVDADDSRWRASERSRIVAEILEFRLVRMIEVGDVAGDDFGLLGCR